MPPDWTTDLWFRALVCLCALISITWFLWTPRGWRAADRGDRILYALMAALVAPWAVLGLLLDVLPPLVTGIGGFAVAGIMAAWVWRSVRWSRRVRREMTAQFQEMQARHVAAEQEAAIDAARRRRRPHAEPEDGRP